MKTATQMSDQHGHTIPELVRLAEKYRAEAESCSTCARLCTKFPDQYAPDCQDPRVWRAQAEQCRKMAKQFEERIPVRAAIDQRERQRELDARADASANPASAGEKINVLGGVVTLGGDVKPARKTLGDASASASAGDDSRTEN